MLRRSVYPAEVSKVYWFMHALGRPGLPAKVTVGGTPYALACTVKHDFYAATGFYEDSAGRRIVVKFGRTEPLMGLPMAWLGRWLCDREVRFYRRLRHVRGVPALLGRVSDTGFAHAYVEGHPLQRHDRLDAAFFQEFKKLLEVVHGRGVAYVDLNKPSNIILGTDGLPYLIDFQISWDAFLLPLVQRGDWYHYAKHKRRMRPDLLTSRDEELLDLWTIRLHRQLRKPFVWIRKPVMRWLSRHGRMLPQTSE